MFALHAIITKTLSSKKRLYRCFVDFRKAFDYVDRLGLWYKLSKLGIRGKFLRLIQSMYSHAKSRGTQHGKCSKFFLKHLGSLMQGEIFNT